MSKFPSQTQDKFTVRFPEGLRDKIAERAKNNGRSMNTEIIMILEEAINTETVHTDNYPFVIEQENRSEMFSAIVKELNEVKKTLNENNEILWRFTIEHPESQYVLPSKKNTNKKTRGD
ncbi:TPA: Arc family DNA-binding protein [Yersinia enterocolitica]|uniref:Arc family DNA-binding protein n=1 Tax=Yersinia sp. J1 TaxID=3424774 RepID=UPI00330A7D0F|nr:Arc family DNA-binding protein [Yersinia enterocolitica]